MKTKTISIAIVSMLLFLSESCVKFPDRKKEENKQNEEKESVYIYPFGNEVQNIVAEITLQTDGSIDLNSVNAEIPYLKYNKSLLFLLTQDDCVHSAYSYTWAAINGKPISYQYYYDAAHLKAGDLPPDVDYLGKTLGGTDGSGNEVRFSFMTTISPESKWMDAASTVQVGYKVNYWRFFMKSGLVWDNVIEMVNYGTGIAFHDVTIGDENRTDSIIKHYEISQNIILNKLAGRECKILSEPNGNKTFVNAALSYEPIQMMSSQVGAIELYPFRIKDDLYKQVLKRDLSSAEEVQGFIESQLKFKKEDRAAISILVHRTEHVWANTLLWINDTYGKDGTDSLWFPNMEEYYEYNYYRIHSSINKVVSNNTIKLTISMPSKRYFYYPSITINLSRLKKENITSISSIDQVSGLSYGNYEGGVMINIDCRKFLVEHATHFVEQYEKNKTNSNLSDARYFVNMLKESNKKAELLSRIK